MKIIKTAIFRLFAVAVLAAGFATSASAQESEVAQVWKRPTVVINVPGISDRIITITTRTTLRQGNGGYVNIDIDGDGRNDTISVVVETTTLTVATTRPQPGGQIIFSDPLTAIVASVSAFSFAGSVAHLTGLHTYHAVAAILRRVNPDDTTIGGELPYTKAVDANTGLFMFGYAGNRRTMEAGDRFFISGPRTDLSSRFKNTLATVFVYRDSSGVLAFAQNTGRVGEADPNAGEFHLDANYQETNDVAQALDSCDPATASCATTPANSANSANSASSATPANSANAGDDSGSSGGGSSGSSGGGAAIGAGIAVVGAAAMLLSGGDFSLFNFTPDIGYSVDEIGYFANAGGRMDFRKDSWHLYYTGGQTNANGEFGEFHYSSGGEYKGELWTAAFSEFVAGETADYNLSLSANLTGGIWEISPVYHLQSRFDKGESETNNSLNLESVLRINRWTIRPSAGFQWRKTAEFGNNARFHLEAVHRF